MGYPGSIRYYPGEALTDLSCYFQQTGEPEAVKVRLRWKQDAGQRNLTKNLRLERLDGRD